MILQREIKPVVLVESKSMSASKLFGNGTCALYLLKAAISQAFRWDIRPTPLFHQSTYAPGQLASKSASFQRFIRYRNGRWKPSRPCNQPHVGVHEILPWLTSHRYHHCLPVSPDVYYMRSDTGHRNFRYLTWEVSDVITVQPRN